jgi:hypothetical protein
MSSVRTVTDVTGSYPLRPPREVDNRILPAINLALIKIAKAFEEVPCDEATHASDTTKADAGSAASEENEAA